MQTQPGKRQYVNYRFFKVDPTWRRLPVAERTRGKKEALRVIDAWKERILVLSYSALGLRPDCDFMLWRASYALEDFEQMSSELENTGFGKFLQPAYSYLSMTKRSIYVDKHQHPGQEGTRLEIRPGQAKYLFVYPFVKTREWYTLDKAERQKMMDVHIAVGHKYPSVKINTSYSFGMDDQEFVVAFETDKPEDFLDCVQDLRESQASRYTLRDTPAFSCVLRPFAEILNLLDNATAREDIPAAPPRSFQRSPVRPHHRASSLSESDSA